MATAESHLGAMQKQRSELAKINSVAQLFQQRVAQDGARTAARRKRGGTWHDVSWTQLAQEAEDEAWGLVALGVQRGEMVATIASTRDASVGGVPSVQMARNIVAFQLITASA